MAGLITPEALREILTYSPDTGLFTWRVTRGKARAGAVAGHINEHGYAVTNLNGRVYRLHRLAWLYMTGAWPVDMIDHKNGRRADNRWENLREATRSQNNANKGAFSAHGFKGATYNKRQGRWLAQIKANGRRHYLGYYDTPEEAHAAYAAAAIRHFGEFARAA
jgi:hypothetical protein